MNNKYLPFILISTFFGLIAGLASFFFMRMNFFESMGLSMFNEIDLNATNKNPSIIIRDAKKIVVEQDDKVASITQATQKSQIAIFLKTNMKNYRTDSSRPAQNYFLPDSRIGEGVALTSDGWILAAIPSLQTTDKTKINKNDYVVMSDKKILDIDKMIWDELTGIFLIKIRTIDLPVINLSQFSGLNSGTTLVGVNYDGIVSVDQIMRKNRIVENIKGGHRLETLELKTGKIDDINFYYNFDGDLACFQSGGVCYPASLYASAIKSLSKFGDLKRSVIDLNYLELSELSLASESQNFTTGVLVLAPSKDGILKKTNTKDKPLLQEGDIIKSLNSIPINSDNTLSEILSDYLPGESVNLSVVRQNKEINLSYTLNTR